MAPTLAVSQAAGASTLTALGLIGGGLLLLALVLALRARRPVVRRPPRRSFEAGRALGVAATVASEKEALDALAHPAVGHVDHAAVTKEGVRFTVTRRKGEPCAVVAGYLSGLMERAWAADARVLHEGCAGKKGGRCVYDIIRAGRRTEGASTRGSANAADRSPRAPRARG